MQTVRAMIAARGVSAAAALRAGAVAGCALLVAACASSQKVAGVPPEPTDYRMRHPITLTEADRTFQIFIGANRGSLNPTQRTELLQFAQNWRHEATGGVVIDLPTGSVNERAAAEALHEVQSVLAASGVPPHNVAVRSYRVNEATLATIRVSYPKITAQAGPCGMWPENIGPGAERDYFENQPYWNLGCAYQRNLAAMVDNPTDLVQPRAESPAYTPRRTMVVDKYRQGQSPATIYQNTTAGKISDVGQ
jgi:pilus assembly protein CpaD